jgi:predicted signal transduction protein with EAL and GGDEF domain
MRPSDIFGRHGGEEFVLGLMDCDAENARRCAERIRTTMESSSIATGSGGAEIRPTTSVAVATLDDETTDIDAFINNADQAVYAAKRAGRNCARSFSRGSARSGTRLKLGQWQPRNPAAGHTRSAVHPGRSLPARLDRTRIRQ